MKVRKPSAFRSIIIDATCSGVPTQNVSSSSTSRIGVRLCDICASQARRAASAVSRMIGLQPAVSSISPMSRPTSSQCRRRTSTLWRRTSAVPIAFHMSAYFATVRSVFRSPLPPIRIGRWVCTGGGRSRMASSAYRPPTGDVTASPSSKARMEPTDSSSQSSRSPKPRPKSMPAAACSRSNHAPPRPAMARPSLMWSRVVSVLATSAGLRNVFAPTSSPSRTRVVTLAHAARVV